MVLFHSRCIGCAFFLIHVGIMSASTYTLTHFPFSCLLGRICSDYMLSPYVLHRLTLTAY